MPPNIDADDPSEFRALPTVIPPHGGGVLDGRGLVGSRRTDLGRLFEGGCFVSTADGFDRLVPGGIALETTVGSALERKQGRRI